MSSPRGRARGRFSSCLLQVVAWAIVLPVLAGTPASGQDAPAPAEGDDGISLNFPENVELKVLVDYVSQRLAINVLYDEQIGSKRITLRAPAKIQPESLLGLLESALKMKGLALADTQQAGWKRIVQVKQLAEIAVSPEKAQKLGADVGATVAVTRVFPLEHADPKQAEQLLRPFLTQPGGNSLLLGEQAMLVVTDYAANITRIEQMLRLIDQPGEPTSVQFVPVQHLESQQLAQQLTQLLQAKAKARAVGGTAPRSDVDVLHDLRTNRLILIGPADSVADTAKVAESLDVSLDLQTRVYTFEAVSPERVDRLVTQLIGELAAKRLYKSAVDTESNLLVVRTTETIHKQLAALKADLDRPVSEQQSPIRFYKLENATAMEVLETIRAIEGQEGLDGSTLGADRAGSGQQASATPTGPNRPPSEPGRETPLPPPYRGDRDGTTAAAPDRGGSDVYRLQGMQVDLAGQSARVIADANTNTIIVVADPSAQQVYGQLIDRLDQRRPQVLLEATVVTLDTSGGYSFGVEISGRQDVKDDGQVVTFSSFGLGTVGEGDDLGRLALTPGLGFNGALISADIADVIVRALKTNARARVVSAPRILVNDNATGTLTSVNEAPFTSVNASDTVATTSFAGFASAGTNVTVTPHISQGDHLQLHYSIELNSFTGEGSEAVPPPRQTDSISSEVMIPDGHTIIVGGLKRRDQSDTRTSIPGLGELPLVGELFSSRTTTDAETTLFVFIRPVILRDDQFKDLKFLSRRAATEADVPGDYPASEPLAIR